VTITVHGPDESRGHIALTDEGGGVIATACDMGPFLDLCTHRGVRLPPSAARDLARALNTWAARYHSTKAREDWDDALVEAIERATS
jgi:hypothetical protein